MEELEEPANKRRPFLIGLIVVLLLCLVGALLINFFSRGGGQTDVAQQETAATATPAPQEPTETPTEEPTATPTEVVEAEPTATPTPETAVDAAAIEPTATATVLLATATPVQITQVVETVEVYEDAEILKNGGFEAGFADNGVALNWESLRTEGAAVNFSAESAEPFVRSGSHAQRVSIDKSFQPDQYGGLVQTVNVVPGKTYTFTVYGQIRSGFGSVEASNYGYRLQYAIAPDGGANWQVIDPAGWVELPWPEQVISAGAPTFSEYSAPFVAQTEQATVIIRAWSKWPDGSLGEYTLDDISLVGPAPDSVQVIAKTTTVESGEPPAAPPAPGGEMVDKPLPVTGFGDDTNLLADGRFWGAVLVLLLLAGGALYQARWRM